MSFTIFFPKQGQEDGAYKHLYEEHEVYEVIKDEVRQCVSDMGSEGHDLIEPEFPWTSETSGKTYAAASELDNEPDAVREEFLDICYTQGIDQAVTMHAPAIFKELWVRFRVGVGTGPEGEDTAVDGVTYSKLPDGTTIALKEVEDE